MNTSTNPSYRSSRNTPRRREFKFQSRRMSSPSDILANAGQVIPEKRVNWSTQKRVPSEILFTRYKQEMHEKVEAIKNKAREKFQTRHGNTGTPSTFIAIKGAGSKGFKILGHGHEDGSPRFAKNLLAVMEFARSINRKFIRWGEREYSVD